MGVSTRAGRDQAWCAVPGEPGSCCGDTAGGLALAWYAALYSRPVRVNIGCYSCERVIRARGRCQWLCGRWFIAPGLLACRRPRKQSRPVLPSRGAGPGGCVVGTGGATAWLMRRPSPGGYARTIVTHRPRMLTKWRSTTRLVTRTKESDQRASIWAVNPDAQ